MNDLPEYTPPKVWAWNKESGGRFANINRPIAGSTHDKELPVGRHPLQLYSLGTPNGVKVTVMLEELLALGHSGAEYDAWLIKIGDGDQFGSGFVAVNPNSKIRLCWTAAARSQSGSSSPAPSWCIWPRSSGLSCRLRSCAGRMPVMAVLADGKRTLSGWRLRPLLRVRADEDRICDRSVRDGSEAPTRRARSPAGETEYLAGGDFTIADMAVWPWYGGLVKGWLYGGAEFLSVQDYKNVQRWADTIGKRKAVERGRMVNRVQGEPSSQLHERHDASDFESKTQDKLAAAS